MNSLQFSRFFYKVITQLQQYPDGLKVIRIIITIMSNYQNPHNYHVGLRSCRDSPIVVITEHDQLSNHAQIRSPAKGGMLCTPRYIATTALVGSPCATTLGPIVPLSATVPDPIDPSCTVAPNPIGPSCSIVTGLVGPPCIVAPDLVNPPSATS
ncbi:hypothetical protein B296_00020838 [Ensete ventricosum]|uniref:Uncharacterized protein n=1 Tax=Ensete ventricosum TaxID=4639 RepID=A0A426ZPS5_ENSVE|nr:hypothetical protein B296_00020838 [Ensete ventricosum]